MCVYHHTTCKSLTRENRSEVSEIWPCKCSLHTSVWPAFSVGILNSTEKCSSMWTYEMLISGLQTLCGENNECQGLGETPRLHLCFLYKPGWCALWALPSGLLSLQVGVCIFFFFLKNGNSSPMEGPLWEAGCRWAQHIFFEWSFPLFVTVWTESFTFSQKFFLVTNYVFSCAYFENPKHGVVSYLTLICGLKLGTRILPLTK